MDLICCEYVSLVSNVMPSILIVFVDGSCVLFSVMFVCLLYSAGSDVNVIVCVLSALSIRLFACVQSCICVK